VILLCDLIVIVDYAYGTDLSLTVSIGVSWWVDWVL